MHELNDGDATFASTFKLIRGKGWATFKPQQGKKFFVLLLGTVDKNAETADIEAALNKLGFYRKEGK